MKTKIACLLTALIVAGSASIAMAGPDLQEQNLRRQIAAAHRPSTVDTGSGHYVANPSGKGGTVTERRDGAPTTNIALFKSKKANCCEEACTVKMKR